MPLGVLAAHGAASPDIVHQLVNRYGQRFFWTVFDPVRISVRVKFAGGRTGNFNVQVRLGGFQEGVRTIPRWAISRGRPQISGGKAGATQKGDLLFLEDVVHWNR